MRIFFCSGAFALGGGLLLWVIWLVLGRAMALSLDRYLLRGAQDRPIGGWAINASDFIVASRKWPLLRTGRFPLKIAMDDRRCLSLSTQGSAFTLGAVSQVWSEPTEPQYQFSPDASDTVTFTRLASRLSWPTSPFRFRIFGVQPPSWHRHVYDRLVWRKGSGATLEIVWRDRQSFYEGVGWTDDNTNQLASVKLQRSAYEATVESYLAAKKGWSPSDYRLEWAKADGQVIAVTVIAAADAKALQPGSGRSVLLHVDGVSRKVIKELAFQ